MKSLHKISEKRSMTVYFSGSKNHFSLLEEKINHLMKYLTTLKENPKNKNFEEHERAIQELTYAIGNEALCESLSTYDVSADYIAVNGQTYTKRACGFQRYQSALGEIRIERQLYANRTKSGDGK